MRGVWDGRGASYKVCMGCEDLRKELNVDQEYDEQICFGDLSEAWFNLIENQDKDMDDLWEDLRSMG